MAEEQSTSHHPLTPPHSEEERVSWLRLLRSRRVGVTTFFRLMAEHGSAAAALEALPEIAAAAGVAGYRPCALSVAEAEMRAGRLAGARLLAWGEADYPRALRDIADAPPLVWARGDTALLRRPMVALVGGRDASALGTRMARRLAGALAESGHVVVSGLARGIDTAAHLAALDRGTLAVLAGGVDVVYPAENAVLAQEIAERGLLLSERPMGLQPQARDFPRRNRIVSGLARAVVVIEAAARSGSLITARMALDQGREVMAVPGHPFDARAAGCNALLRDGALLVRSADDVIEAIGTVEAEAEGEGAVQRSLPLEPAGDGPGARVAAAYGRSVRAPADAPEGVEGGRTAVRTAEERGAEVRTAEERGEEVRPSEPPVDPRITPVAETHTPSPALPYEARRAYANAAAPNAAPANAARPPEAGAGDTARGTAPVESAAVDRAGADHRTGAPEGKRVAAGAHGDMAEAGAAPGSTAIPADIPTGPPSPGRSLSETAELHNRILQRLGPSPLAEDQLIRDLGGATAATTRELVALELDGAIIRQAGGLISRAPPGDD